METEFEISISLLFFSSKNSKSYERRLYIMSNKTLKNSLTNLQMNYENIAKSIEECVKLDSFEDRSKLTDLLTQLLVKSEKATVNLRKLTAQNAETTTEIMNYNSSIIDSSNVEVDIDDDGVITIKMPILLPFKKLKSYRKSLHLVNANTQSESFFNYVKKLGLDELYERINAITGALDIALESFFNTSNLTYSEREKLYSCAIYNFTNYFELKKNSIYPDPDNLEYKQIIDIVANHLTLGDDNHISIILSNKLADSTYSELKIFPNFEQFALYKNIV